MRLKESAGIAGVVAVMVGGMIAYTYSEAAGIQGTLMFVLWLSHSACLFIPFEAYLRMEKRLIDAREESARKASGRS